MFWRGSSDFEMVESVAGWRTAQFFLLNRKMRFWTWKIQQKLRFEIIGSVEGWITVHNRRILVSFLQKERNFDRLQTKTQFRTGKAGKLRFCDDRMNRLLKHSSKTKETCLLVCYFLQKRGNFIFCRERSDFELWQHQKLRFWDERIDQQLKNSSNSKKFRIFSSGKANSQHNDLRWYNYSWGFIKLIYSAHWRQFQFQEPKRSDSFPLLRLLCSSWLL